MKKNIVIYGCGELGRRLRLYFERENLNKVLAFVSDGENDVVVDDLPVYSFDRCKELYPKEECYMFVAIGYSKVNTIREKICKKCREAGYQLINYISPKSNCWNNVVFGDNVFVEDNVFIGDHCKIGNGVFIKAGCVLCHNDELQDYVFFSGGVVVGGDVIVKKNSFVGLNATLKSHITISEFNVVGSGANIVYSTASNCVLVGNPAKCIEKNVMDVNI